MESMEMKPRFVALIISVILIVLIIELVRRRKLREEYSWLWLSLSVLMCILALGPDLLDFITRLIGAVVPTSTLFFFALIFMIFINIQFSVEISTLRNQVKNLAQQIAILDNQIEEGLALHSNHTESRQCQEEVRGKGRQSEPSL